ncbi:hypothetical protein KA005_62760 [bacterium]|nr:hypothetical protein [bacterium]
MKQHIRNKVIRMFASSILASDLTANDIRKVANSLIRDNDFLWDLGSTFKDIAENLDTYSVKKRMSNYNYSDVSDLLSKALNIVKRKRLSKQRILEYISEISPNDYLSSLDAKITIREILLNFFNRKSNVEKSELLNLLETGVKGRDDEYLKGIMRRK